MARAYLVMISPKALGQLADIVDYIYPDSPSNAAKVLDRLLDDIFALEDFPGRYAKVDDVTGGQGELRRMPVPPFRVYFEIDKVRPVVWIVGVEHGARDTH